MGFFEFIFVILLVIPVAVVMIVLFRKLTAEYNVSMKKEHNVRSGRHRKTPEPDTYDGMKNYRRDNPAYDAYKRRLEEQNLKRR